MLISNYQVKNFSKSEFSEDPVKYAHSNLIISLDKLRDFINKPIYPSPVSGALARFSGSNKSEHYSVYRLSTAVDVFIDEDPFISLIKILQSSYFSGIGFYLDTYYKGKPWVLFHLDLRKKPLIWCRQNNTYYYNMKRKYYQELLNRKR